MTDSISMIFWMAFSLSAFFLFQVGVLTRRRIERRWVRVRAVVRKSEVVAGRWGLAQPRVTYEYDAEDYRFLGEYRPWGIAWGLRTSASTAAEQFPPGRLLSVLVNPENHQKSMVRPWPPAAVCAALFLVTVVSLGLSLSSF